MDKTWTRHRQHIDRAWARHPTPSPLLFIPPHSSPLPTPCHSSSRFRTPPHMSPHGNIWTRVARRRQCRHAIDKAWPRHGQDIDKTSHSSRTPPHSSPLFPTPRASPLIFTLPHYSPPHCPASPHDNTQTRHGQDTGIDANIQGLETIPGAADMFVAYQGNMAGVYNSASTTSIEFPGAGTY